MCTVTKPVLFIRTRMEAEGRAGSGTMVWLGALRDTEKVILASDRSRQIT